MKKIITIGIILLMSCVHYCYASKKGSAQWEQTVTLGVNIGGTIPYKFPATIRSIESFHPKFNVSTSVSSTYFFTSHWGVSVGLRYDNKAMETSSTVKAYQMTMTLQTQEEPISGLYTGGINSCVDNHYLSLPIALKYRINKWRLGAGTYIAYLIHGEFSGVAENGYIRKTPVDPKIGVEKADYDFSPAINKIDVGGELFAQYLVHDSFTINANLGGSFIPLLKKDESPMNFNLYNLYLGVGVGYHF